MKQLTSKSTVEYRGHTETALDVAREVANRLHAINKLTGVLTDGIYAPSGLTKLANKYLYGLPNQYNGALIEEVELGNGQSHYYPIWR